MIGCAGVDSKIIFSCGWADPVLIGEISRGLGSTGGLGSIL